MEKKILEELDKFRLLSNYDNNKTLNENYTSIISEDGIAKNVLKAAEELKAAKSAISADAALLKGVTSTEGKILKSADDILNALKADKIVGKELARVNRTLFNSAESSLKLKNAIAKDMALSDDFAKLYGGLNEKDAIQKLISKKGYTVEQSNMITSQYKKNGKSFGGEVSKGINKTVTKEGDIIVKGNNNTVVIAKDGSSAKVVNNETKEITQINKGQKIKRQYNCVKRVCNGGKGSVELVATELPTVKIAEELDTMNAGLLEASLKAMTPGFNWKRLVAWAAGLGIGAGLLWWYFATNDKKVPDDIPTTPPKDGDGDDGGDFPLEDGVYTTPGDPYQYKVVECVWYTKSWKNRGKIIKDWISLANNKKATDILDGRHPDARKNCNGNTTPQPVVTTGSTSTQDVVNQQYGVTPQPNAQAEVQTTNDDINNY
jgi:hypothetical protein